MGANKVIDVEVSDISEIIGTQLENISEVIGQEISGGGAVASRWIAGSAGKLYDSEVAAATSGWGELVDLSTGTVNISTSEIRDIAYGEGAMSTKQWVIFIRSTTYEVGKCLDNDTALARDFNDAGSPRWSTVTVSNDMRAATYGGPAVAWGNSVWITAGEEYVDGDDYYYFNRSTDNGSSFSNIQATDAERSFPSRCVAYKSGNDWFAVNDSDVWKSTDNGASWALALEDAGGVTGWFNCMAYDGSGTWVAAGNAGRVAYSSDDWATASESSSSKTSGVTNGSAIFGVVFCAGSVNMFIGICNNGRIVYSSDGDTWTRASSDETTKLNAIATDNTTIVAVGNGGYVVTSTNGTSWSTVSHSPAVTVDLFCIACDIIGAGMR